MHGSQVILNYTHPRGALLLPTHQQGVNTKYTVIKGKGPVLTFERVSDLITHCVRGLIRSESFGLDHSELNFTKVATVLFSLYR